MTKDEMENRISMAIKDPILQQGFEIICKELTDLQKEVIDLRQDKNKLEEENNKLLDVINGQDVKIADLEKENKKLDRALITSTKNNIERQKIIDSLQAEKEKEKMQTIANCSDKEEGLRRKIFKLENQIEKMTCCENCKHKNLNWSFRPICEARDKIVIGNPLTCKCNKWEIKENE